MSILTMRLNQGIVFSSQIWFFCSVSHPSNYFFSASGGSFCLFGFFCYVLFGLGFGFFFFFTNMWVGRTSFSSWTFTNKPGENRFQLFINFTYSWCLHLKFKCHLCLYIYSLFPNVSVFHVLSHKILGKTGFWKSFCWSSWTQTSPLWVGTKGKRHGKSDPRPDKLSGRTESKNCRINKIKRRSYSKPKGICFKSFQRHKLFFVMFQLQKWMIPCKLD